MFSCNKDDDNNADCVKDNYFKAQFDGEAIEPRWITGLGFSAYTLYVDKNNQEENDWGITLTSENRISLHFSLINVLGTGHYPIADAASSIIPPIPYNMYSKTYIYLEKVKDDNTHFFFSIENTGSIEVTHYDNEKGILIGTFSCDLYSSTNPDIVKPISGEFNINLSTLDIDKTPCWM